MTITATLLQIDPWLGLRSFLERAADRPWATLVELLMIGCVVYAVLRSLQGTRGARLVRAVLTILVLSFAVVWLVAEQFGFERVNVLYPYFVLGVFLVSLVAFQTELRRVLVRLGEGGWLSRWLRSSPERAEPIVTAVEHLAAKHVGALIALERNTELGAWSETGVRLDAVVTAEVLETIFYPGTPLHDLGVIVDQGRVVAAGCQFPLAESGDVERGLGSRHRAAVGMSQEGDAVVIVVSEETGTISVAIRGQLRRGLSAAALRDLLSKELATDRRAQSETPAAAQVHKPEEAEGGTGQAA